MPDLTREADALLAEGLLKLDSREYVKAEDSLRKALHFNPQLARAHRALGEALSYQAVAIGDPGRKAAVLDDAERNVRRSEELQGDATVGTLHDLAWIYDERGTPADLRKAIELYRLALARFGATESPTSNDLTPLHYNLACALTKIGDLPAAFEILSRLIGERWRGEAMRRSIEHDSDFEPLRRAPDFGERLRQALADERAAEKVPEGGETP